MIVPIIFKLYYTIQLEKDKDGICNLRKFYKFWLWWAPIIRKTQNPKKKAIIRKANIAVGIFWAMFFGFLLVTAVIFAI